MSLFHHRPSLLHSGPPSKPAGPLKAKDIERTSVTLEWQPPSDDGGSPLTGYILEKRDIARPTWTRVEKLSANKTSYKVQNLPEGSDYHFRVSAENKHGTSEPLETEKTVKPKSPFGESDAAPFSLLYLMELDGESCFYQCSFFSPIINISLPLKGGLASCSCCSEKELLLHLRELRVGSNIMIRFLYILLLLIWHMYLSVIHC